MGKWNDFYNERVKATGALAKINRESFKAFGELKDAAIKDVALTAKQKELIALGIAIATHCEGCMVFHTKACVAQGATREEVIETISTALFMSGGPATIFGGMVLEMYDEFKNC
ncbi:MAG: carboxymuconolactone decarboxylase family protein [Alphaproteobacteria bacterium]|nr:carboxymuconolactone decarboxylase family protein [Alphaproteobacteria bacterium]